MGRPTVANVNQEQEDQPRGSNSLGGSFSRSPSPQTRCESPGRDVSNTIADLERWFAPELDRISPQWTCTGLAAPGGAVPAAGVSIDVSDVLGLPGSVLGIILAGKCRDQHIGITLDRQRRFAEWMCTHCDSLWFNMNDNSAGPESAKGVCLALAMSPRFTSLNLSNNSLGDAGATTLSKAIPKLNSLVHLDLAANDLNHRGANAIFAALLSNQSVTSLDLSSKTGGLRNHLCKHNGYPLECLMLRNPVLAKLSLQGTGLGTEGSIGLARGLVANRSLLTLDLAGCDLGARGAAAIAEALADSCLEELNLSDNRIGDEGLVAIAVRIGAPPPEPGQSGTAPLQMQLQSQLRPKLANSSTLDGSSNILNGGNGPAGSSSSGANNGTTGSINPANEPGLESAVKYREHLHVARGSVLELNPTVLAGKSGAQRDETIAMVKAKFEKVAAAMDRSIPLPKLKVLSLANNGGSVLGVSCVEEALHINDRLNKLILDGCDHRGTVRSLVGALPMNRALKHLSLGSSRLGSVGCVELAKALPLNNSLETLSLRGNDFGGHGAAQALGAVLSLTTHRLRTLNLSSCHLKDDAGVCIAQGLAANKSLEILLLRDNGLRERSGRAFVDAMRRHTLLTTLNLELNSIDCRFLMPIAQFLDRNAKLRERAKPDQYRRRIVELEGCKKEVEALSGALQQIDERRTESLQQKQEVQQELDRAKSDAKVRGDFLENRLDQARRQRMKVEEEVAVFEEKVRKVTSEGEYDVSQLLNRIYGVDDRIKQHERHIHQSKGKLETFEADAVKALATAKEELEKAEKARNSAALLTAAAQRNLDSYLASMKSIEGTISGASNPRKRFVEGQKKERNGSKGRRARSAGGDDSRAGSKATPDGSPPRRPRSRGAGSARKK